MSPVLVTGGSGFVASHAIVRLLSDGHVVRTTVRRAGREEDVRRMLSAGGVADHSRLSFHLADLNDDAGWADAVAGCDHVLHIASPFPAAMPEDVSELVDPAREGTLRVLRAARDAGVRRVVQTSSFAAIGYGDVPPDRPLDESDWTDPDHPTVSAYTLSKTLAERAAWDFIESEGGDLELSVVNPVLVLGPVLDADYATSVMLVHRLLRGDMPGCPKLHYGIVDVRDVVDLHVRAMTDPSAAGERFLATSDETLSVGEMAQILRRRLGDAASEVPTLELPNWVVRVFALFNDQARAIAPQLGKRKRATAAKAREMLGWSSRSAEEAIVASGESLVNLGLVDT